VLSGLAGVGVLVVSSGCSSSAGRVSSAAGTTTTTTASVPTGPRVRSFDGLPAFDRTLGDHPSTASTRVRVPGDAEVLGFAGYAGSTWWIETSSAAAPLAGGVLPLDGSVSALHLRGSPLSFAEGEGARWVMERLVQNGSDYRLERFALDGTTATDVNPVPVDGQPAGRLAVGAGGVWIPLRTGVARMDTRTGRLAKLLPLAFDESRSLVVSGAQVIVSDLNAVRTIDPATNVVSPRHVLVPAGRGWIYGLAVVDGHIWAAIGGVGDSTTLVGLDAALRVRTEVRLPLQLTFFPMDGAGGRLSLVAGLRIGVPPTAAATDMAVVIVDPVSGSVTRTIVIHGYAGAIALTPDSLLFGDLQQPFGGGAPLDAHLYEVPA
jgi:hypothetical protein